MRIPSLVLFSILAFLPQLPAQESDFMENRWVTILTAQKSFAEAKKDAEKIAKESGLPFSMEGRVYDKKAGLIYPRNYEDEVFAGQYVARRYNETSIKNKDTAYLSIERSDGYDGFTPGYYIVVAGVYESAKDAQAQAKRFSPWAPTAYAKKTKIYMGCMH